MIISTAARLKEKVRSFSYEEETMSLRRLVPYFLMLAAACLPLPASSQARRSAVWFEGARLIIGDKSPAIESSAFLVEGDSFTWAGKKGEKQPPANAIR